MQYRVKNVIDIISYSVLFSEYVMSKREDTMAEHIMHKKDTKKVPKKTLKEKREDKKAKKKDKSTEQ